MRVRVGDAVRTGRAIDLRAFGQLRTADLAPATVAEAIRGDSPLDVDCSPELDGRFGADLSLAVDCPDPGSAHERVGAIGPDVTLARRPALAAAARSRDHVAPQAEELVAVRKRLDALDPPTVDLRRARERVADAGDAEAEWRERVATLRGRVQALRDADADSGDAEADLAEATRHLSEVETERIAAEQALARARERARETREIRRERLRLEDRAGNLRRAARDYLTDCVVDDFADALASLVGGGVLMESEDAVSSDDVDPLAPEVADALAVVRVADLDAPVALARDVNSFGGPEAAARWLDAPVILV